jgi:hypothetical protein
MLCSFDSSICAGFPRTHGIGRSGSKRALAVRRNVDSLLLRKDVESELSTCAGSEGAEGWMYTCRSSGRSQTVAKLAKAFESGG